MYVDMFLFNDLFFGVEFMKHITPPYGFLWVPRMEDPNQTWVDYLRSLASEYMVFIPNYFYKFYLILDSSANSLYSYFWVLKYKGLVNMYGGETYSLEVTFYTAVYVTTTTTFLLVFIWVAYLIFMYFIIWGLKSATSKKNFLGNSSYLYGGIYKVVEGCGQFEDLISYSISAVFFGFWFYFYTIFASQIISKYSVLIIAFILLLCLTAWVLPTKLLYKCGLAFPQYIRGAGRSTSLAYEMVLDFMAVSIMAVRLLVQNIRFLFIFFACFEYYEYIMNTAGMHLPTLLPYITWESYWAGDFKEWKFYEFGLQLAVQAVEYLYYIGHLTAVYIAQFTIYILLSFWIFLFLYTTFVVPSPYKYFFYKRYGLLIK